MKYIQRPKLNFDMYQARRILQIYLPEHALRMNLKTIWFGGMDQNGLAEWSPSGQRNGAAWLNQKYLVYRTKESLRLL